ncbi:MAG TPA: DUF2339 domain-containing protein, partial [Psychromonas sp.]
MQLMDELAKLSAELEILQSEQLKQQQSTEQRLRDFSIKLNKLSQLLGEDFASPSAADKQFSPSLNTGSDRQIKTSQQTDKTDLSSPVNTPSQSGAANTAANEQRLSESDQLPDSHLQISDPWLQGKIISIPGKKQSQHGQTQNSFSKVKQAAALLGENLADFFSASLGPFAGISHQLKAFYKHYQAKGLGPVFLMTVAGIITLTLGFAYLFQYSLNNWLSETGKALLVFAAANMIIISGLFLRRKRPEMEDFTLALVGLGVTLNYLSAYFVGPYFQLVSDSVCFTLLLLITAAGFVISIKLASKVTSLVVLAGGSAVPLMLLSNSNAPLLYLPYLLLIGCCAVLQSRLLRWPLLLESTTLLHIACIELFVFDLDYPFVSLDWQVIVALFSINLIFYLYGFSGIYWLIKDQRLLNQEPQADHKEGLFTRRILVLPFALLAFTLLTISQATLVSGEIFLINSLICTLIGFKVRAQKSLRGLLLVFAGCFAGFAALYLISEDLLGLVLLVEGLLLLWLGGKESYKSLRMEAYILLALGLIMNVIGLSHAIVWLDYDLYDFSQYGFSLTILLLSNAALFMASLMITKQLSVGNSSACLTFEYKVGIIVKELLSVSYAASLLFASNLILFDKTTHLLPLLSLLLLYLAARDQLKFTELLAWLMIVPLIGQVSYAILTSGSLSFSEQPLYARFARVELFLSLLLAYYWYRRYFADSKIIKMVYWLQLLCFMLLPLLFLPKVLRDFESYISVALWGSCFISLLSARLLRSRILIAEAKLLTFAAFIMTGLSCLVELWQGMLALLIGALLMLAVNYRYAQMNRLSQLMVRFVWLLSPYYFALVIAVIVQTLMQFALENWGVVGAALCAYFVLLITRRPVLKVLRGSFALLYTLIFISAITPLLMHVQLPLAINTQSLLYIISELLVLIILAKFMLARGVAVRFYQARLPLPVLYWGWHILFALSYLLWSYQFSNMIAAPLSAILLVVHGSWLMFISLREELGNMIRLATGLFVVACTKVLFIDMASFEIVQKVIAFMVIGAILLSVSFFYQKAR